MGIIEIVVVSVAILIAVGAGYFVGFRQHELFSKFVENFQKIHNQNKELAQKSLDRHTSLKDKVEWLSTHTTQFNKDTVAHREQIDKWAEELKREVQKGNIEDGSELVKIYELFGSIKGVFQEESKHIQTLINLRDAEFIAWLEEQVKTAKAALVEAQATAEKSNPDPASKPKPKSTKKKSTRSKSNRQTRSPYEDEFDEEDEIIGHYQT